MRWHRYILYLLPLAGLASLAALAALGGKASNLGVWPGSPTLTVPGDARTAVDPPEELEPLDPSGPDDEGAGRLLDRALASLARPEGQWIQSSLVQKVRLPGLAFDAEGRYVAAPGDRFRIELRTFPGRKRTGACGEVLLVCDGATVSSGHRVADGAWRDLNRRDRTTAVAQGATEAAPAPPHSSQSPADRVPGLTFAGMEPMLRALRGSLRWVHSELMPGGSVRLTGVWSAARLAALASPGQPWPAGLPRRCRLVLGTSPAWPERVEWWGPSVPGGPDHRLVELEFRDTRFDQPLPPAVCAREFSFSPGSTVVTSP